MPPGRRGPLPTIVLLACAACALALASACGSGLVKQYEYEEDIYLELDGSATIYVNASIPALVNLRGLDLNTAPTALLDRAKLREIYTSPAARVVRISTWRRLGRRFVQVRLAVDDVTNHGEADASAAAAPAVRERPERQENRAVMLGRDAGAVVGDGNGEVRAFVRTCHANASLLPAGPPP